MSTLQSEVALQRYDKVFGVGGSAASGSSTDKRVPDQAITDCDEVGGRSGGICSADLESDLEHRGFCKKLCSMLQALTISRSPLALAIRGEEMILVRFCSNL